MASLDRQSERDRYRKVLEDLKAYADAAVTGELEGYSYRWSALDVSNTIRRVLDDGARDA